VNIMEKIFEPPCNLQICLSRELTDFEFNNLTEILDEYVGDYIEEEEVIVHYMHHRDLGQDLVCYMFTLNDYLVTEKTGSYIGDELSDAIDKILPEDVYWEIEASVPDQEIDIDDSATESDVFESVQNQLKRLVKG
jgi:hypothetical protein